MEYESYKDFFDKTGDNVLHPKIYDECMWPVTVEEMYLHFKARMIDEVRAYSQELLNPVDLEDTSA